jgi:zinc-ribbon domain
MDIIVAIVGLAMAVVVGAYIAQPLLARVRVVSALESPRDQLLAERNALYVAIRDLDFDFQTGKLLEADHAAVREKYLARGVEILKQLDALPVDRRRSGADQLPQKARADDIEVAVQDRRGRRAQPQLAEDEIEAAVHARRRFQAAKQGSETSPKCPSCGHPVDPTDRFCGKCGAALAAEVTL